MRWAYKSTKKSSCHTGCSSHRHAARVFLQSQSSRPSATKTILSMIHFWKIFVHGPMIARLRHYQYQSGLSRAVVLRTRYKKKIRTAHRMIFLCMDNASRSCRNFVRGSSRVDFGICGEIEGTRYNGILFGLFWLLEVCQFSLLCCSWGLALLS
jgi:hypothetical protein